MTDRRPTRPRRVGRRKIEELEEITVAMAPQVARHRRRGALVRVIGTRRFPTDVSAAFGLAIHQDWPSLLGAISSGDLTSRDPLGNTFLHYAASWGHLPTVVTLVAAGVPIGFRNQQELTAEDLARERGYVEIATYLACREHQSIPIPWRHRFRALDRVEGNRLRLGRSGRSSAVALDDITAVALSGPWRRRRSLLLAVGHPEGGPRPAGDDFSTRDLAALGDRVTVIGVPVASPHLLWDLLSALIERHIPVGTMAHRWTDVDGWDGRRATAAAQPSNQLVVEPVDAVPVSAPVRGLALLPSGFFVVRSGDDGDTESLVSWTTFLHLARHHATDDPQIDLQMDQTFPWVEQVAAEVRATGIDGAHPTDMVSEPTSPHGGTALHAHLWAGRNDLAIDLVGAGFDVHRSDRFGRTPLHIAAGLGAGDVVQVLLARGADPDARDDAGRRPGPAVSG